MTRDAKMYNKAYHIGGTEEETYRVHANDCASHLFPTLEQPTHQRGVYVCVLEMCYMLRIEFCCRCNDGMKRAPGHTGAHTALEVKGPSLKMRHIAMEKPSVRLLVCGMRGDATGSQCGSGTI